MVNKALLSPRNIIVIGVLATLAHIVARPVYNMINKKDESDDG